MKSLDEIKADMSRLYDQVNNGEKDLKEAAELANIAGKFLKAEQLALAREIFLDHSRHRVQVPLLNGVELHDPATESVQQPAAKPRQS